MIRQAHQQKNPKIHFAALFGVEYDLDLMPAWTEYYRNMELDSYKVFLHSEYTPVGDNIAQEFRNRGFETQIVGGHQANGILRKLVIAHYASTLPPDDVLVTADADEFHCFPGGFDNHATPKNPPDYRRLFETYDIITGFMVDRYEQSFKTCHSDPFYQYDREEPFTAETLKNFTPPFLRAFIDWPYTRRTKILAARAGLEVSYEGSHCMLTVPANAKIAENFRVIHFHWRESARRKMATKSYFLEHHVAAAYDGKIPADILEKMKKLRPEFLMGDTMDRLETAVEKACA